MAGDASSLDYRRGYGEGGPSDIHLTVPARADSIAVVRHALSALAGPYDLPSAVVDDMRLAVTEACTNVVRHAYGEQAGRIEVTVRPASEALQVVVADAGQGMGRSPDTAGPGLGLRLIEAVTDSFAVESEPGAAGSRLVMSFRRVRGPRVMEPA
jgi:serine/threonine-protein kinase RsbW